MPYTYTADLGQYDEPDIASVPGRAAGVRRRDRPAGRLPGGPRRGGAGRAGLRGVPHPVRRPRLLQHHPAGPGGHRHPAGPGDARGRRADLGRRLDLQGQRHRAVLPLRAARQPEPADLQAVARRGLRQRARRPHGDVASGCSTASCPTATARRRRTRPTRTSGAPPTRPSRSSTSTTGIEIVEPIMGVRFWDPAVEIAPEDVTIGFEHGRPVAINGKEFALAGRRSCSRPTRSAAGTAWACPTRSRTGSSRPRAAGIYEAPGMALLHAAYERLVNAIHNEDTLAALPRRGPPARPAAVRGPLARPAGADAPRVAAALGRHRGHRAR